MHNRKEQNDRRVVCRFFVSVAAEHGTVVLRDTKRLLQCKRSCCKSASSLIILKHAVRGPPRRHYLRPALGLWQKFPNKY